MHVISTVYLPQLLFLFKAEITDSLKDTNPITLHLCHQVTGENVEMPSIISSHPTPICAGIKS